ncbi:alanine racemase, partial [Candidatus Poribacteria bacterium]|nr:alanine racemase [Candidatus Poribacteria bacterium]
MSITDNILKIKEKISEACKRSNRNPEDIIIVCVTKTIPINQILEAVNSGMKIIGENKIQETKEKYEVLKGKTGFHFIGHLQQNKVKEAVRMFDMIQSVDSISLANALSIESQKQNKILDILVEVKTSIDPAKYGAEPDNLEKILYEIIKFPSI